MLTIPLLLDNSNMGGLVSGSVGFGMKAPVNALSLATNSSINPALCSVPRLRTIVTGHNKRIVAAIDNGQYHQNCLCLLFLLHVDMSILLPSVRDISVDLMFSYRSPTDVFPLFGQLDYTAVTKNDNLANEKKRKLDSTLSLQQRRETS